MNWGTYLPKPRSACCGFCRRRNSTGSVERTLKADVRVVAATNRNLVEMVAAGSFREDLFYRLEVIPVHLPPLRERKGDIPLLVEHFLAKKSREMNLPFRRLTEDALQILCDYSWPGNVRELENVIERTIVLADGDHDLGPTDIPQLSRDSDDSDIDNGSAQMPMTERLERLEKELISQAMKDSVGVKTQAADLLGIKASALYYKLDKYGLGDGGRVEMASENGE